MSSMQIFYPFGDKKERGLNSLAERRLWQPLTTNEQAHAIILRMKIQI